MCKPINFLLSYFHCTTSNMKIFCVLKAFMNIGMTAKMHGTFFPTYSFETKLFFLNLNLMKVLYHRLIEIQF